MNKIQTDNAPQPKGHYSQAVAHGGLVFVSGQLAVNAAGQPVIETIEAQTEQCLRNVEAVLLAAGSDLARVLKMTIYVSDESLWGAVNETYARVMGARKPARAIIPVNKFRGDFLIEVEAIAAVKDDE